MFKIQINCSLQGSIYLFPNLKRINIRQSREVINYLIEHRFHPNQKLFNFYITHNNVQMQ